MSGCKYIPSYNKRFLNIQEPFSVILLAFYLKIITTFKALYMEQSFQLFINCNYHDPF